MREYELMFIVDPRLPDEEVVEISDQYKEMIEAAGGDVYKAESWGKRKLAYPIEKLNEGNYTLFHVRTANGSPFSELEQRMRQNEKVLRYLTIRTDAGRLRKRGGSATEETEEQKTEASSSQTQDSTKEGGS